MPKFIHDTCFQWQLLLILHIIAVIFRREKGASDLWETDLEILQYRYRSWKILFSVI